MSKDVPSILHITMASPSATLVATWTPLYRIVEVVPESMERSCPHSWGVDFGWQDGLDGVH